MALQKAKRCAECFVGLFPGLYDFVDGHLEEPACELAFLKKVGQLASLPHDELVLLTRAAEERQYNPGSYIAVNGRKADGVYIVKTGIAVLKDNEGITKSTYANLCVFGYPLDGAETSIAPNSGDSSSPTSKPPKEDSKLGVYTDNGCTCIFIAAHVIRMLDLRPPMPYDFAIVLNNSGKDKDAEYASQKEIVKNLIRAGITVSVLKPTQTSRERLVILLSAPMWLIAREDRLLKMERAIEYLSADDATAIGDETDDATATKMPSADKLQAFVHLLTRDTTAEPPGAGIKGIEGNKNDGIISIFPLHDAGINDFLVTEWSVRAEHKRSVNQLLLNRIKNHFGLEAAFYFAYIRLYTRALVWPSVLGALLWIVWRWIDYATYQAALGFFGMGTSLVWAPMMIKMWRRQVNELKVEWGLVQVQEVEYENPNFRDYEIEKIDVADPGDSPEIITIKSYNSHRRWIKHFVYAGFFVICLGVLACFLALYLQWYIVAVMTPSCDDPRCEWVDMNTCMSKCTETIRRDLGVDSCSSYCAKGEIYGPPCTSFLGCFHTVGGKIGSGRWFYIFIQGVVLGITIDILFTAIFEAIAARFNEWENWRTTAEKDNGFIMKTFVFTWMGYFYWFLVLAFVYIPYGDDIQRIIRQNVDANKYVTFGLAVQYSREWSQRRLAMDSAFVTPLIVTQGLNVLVNTFLPWLGRKAVLRASHNIIKTKDEIDENMKSLKRAIMKRSHHTAAGAANARSPPIAIGAISTPEDSGPSTPTASTPDIDHSPRVVQASPVGPNEIVPTVTDAENISPMTADNAVSPAALSEALVSSPLSQSTSGSGSHSKYTLIAVSFVERIQNELTEVYRDLDLGTAIAVADEFVCRNYDYNADVIIAEGGLGFWSPFSDLLHQCIQFSFITLFTVVWPFCALCGFVNNKIVARFDIIKMCIDNKRPVPKRVVGIGSWDNILVFEAVLAAMIVPGLYVAVTGGFDAYFNCRVSEDLYGPTDCLTVYTRLIAFVVLENIGFGVLILVISSKSDISTSCKQTVAMRGRKVRYRLRESMRTIGRTLLVGTEKDYEWREGSVLWLRKGNLKVSLKEEGILPSGEPKSFWLDNEKWVEKSLVPLEVLEPNIPVLLSHEETAGRWYSGKIIECSNMDKDGNELTFQPDKLILHIYQGFDIKVDAAASTFAPISTYCVAEVGEFSARTPTCTATAHPVWDSSFRFNVTDKQLMLKVSTYNHTALVDTLIGEVLFPLSQLLDGKFKKERQLLKAPSKGNPMSPSSHSRKACGSIMLGLQWVDSRLPCRVNVEVGTDQHKAFTRWIWKDDAINVLRTGFGTEKLMEKRKGSVVYWA